MMMVTIVVFGLFSLPKMGIDQLPNVDIPIITVTTILPGADPETIEKDVTDPLEEVLNTTPGIDTLSSINLENVSQIVVRFALDTEVDVAAQDVRDKVQSVLSKLPADVRAPQVQKLDLGAKPILTLALRGPLPPDQLTAVAEDQLKPALQQLPGVGTVELFGDRQLEIRITLDLERLRAFGLTPMDAVAALRAQDMDLAGGRTAEPSLERIVKLRAEAHSVEELRQVVLVSPKGVPVRLSDVAEVTASPAEPRGLARVGKDSVIGVSVLKQTGVNTVKVADGVRNSLARLTSTLPKGCRVDLVDDDSSFIRSSIGAVQNDLILGGLFAVMVVLVFLRNWRSTLISAVALPTSVVGTFAVMHAFDFTFNLITMVALTLSIGLLIDDAIVVIENIVRHLEQGMSPLRAAAEGTRQIAVAVLAVTLSIVAVFLPVAFMEGIVGRFFVQFGVTVVAAVLISYLVSIVLTPMLSARLLHQGEHPERGLGRLVERGLLAIERAYRRMLAWVLGHRVLTILGATLVLVGTFMLARRMESAFAPPMDMSAIQVSVELPAGSRLSDTERQMADLVDQIGKVPGVLGTYSKAGGGAKEEVQKGEILVTLVSTTKRRFTQEEMKQYLRAHLRPLPSTRMNVLDGKVIASGGGRLQAIQFSLLGTDTKQLEAAAEKTRRAMMAHPGFVDVDMTHRPGKPQLDVVVDRDRAAAVGIAAAPLGQALRVLLGRDKVADFKRDGTTAEIRMTLPDSVLADPMALGAVQIRSPSGALVELRSVARLTPGEGPAEIDRKSQVRQITMLADLRDFSMSAAMRFLDDFAAKQLPPGIRTSYEGQSGELASTGRAFALAIGLGVILLYIILAAQFESLIHPFTIMMALPFSVVGALGGLFLVRQDLSIFAMIGIIMLMGLVAKNGILLVEFTNQLKHQGRSTHQALLEAGPIRLRPILMTTVAMIAGMLPVALARGDGAELRAPMAVAVIGGLVTSTLLTLVVVPVVYSLLDGLARRVVGRGDAAACQTAGATGSVPPTSTRETATRKVPSYSGLGHDVGPAEGM